jgi:hypothetical protein
VGLQLQNHHYFRSTKILPMCSDFLEPHGLPSLPWSTAVKHHHPSQHDVAHFSVPTQTVLVLVGSMVTSTYRIWCWLLKYWIPSDASVVRHTPPDTTTNQLLPFMRLTAISAIRPHLIAGNTAKLETIRGFFVNPQPRWIVLLSWWRRKQIIDGTPTAYLLSYS